MPATSAPPKTKPTNTSQPGASQPVKPAFECLTVRQALDKPKPKFLVQDYVTEGSINFIVGPPGSGKSFFALDLACEMIKPNLGLMSDSWPILRQLRVMYMSDEGITEICSKDGRLVSLLAHKQLYDQSSNILHPPTDNLLIIPDMLNLFLDVGRVRYQEFLIQFSAFRPDVILVDTYANCVVGSEENSNKEVNRIGQNLRKLKSDMNCALILLHHTAKGINISKGSPYVGRGAGSLGGFSDCIIGLQPDKDDEDTTLVHCCKNKHGRLQPSVTLTRMSHQGFYYPYLSYEPYSSKVKRQVQQKQDEIVEALTLYGAMNTSNLVQSVSLSKSSTDRRLKELIKDGLVKQFLQDDTKPVSRNNPFMYDVIKAVP